MAKTLVVIVYSPNQGLRRTVIIPDDDKQVPMHTSNLARGEAVMVGSLSDYRTYGPDNMLKRYLGRNPTTDRCAVINHIGNVIAIILADPTIDKHPEGRLHRDPKGVAKVGDKASGLGLLP